MLYVITKIYQIHWSSLCYKKEKSEIQEKSWKYKESLLTQTSWGCFSHLGCLDHKCYVEVLIGLGAERTGFGLGSLDVCHCTQDCGYLEWHWKLEVFFSFFFSFLKNKTVLKDVLLCVYWTRLIRIFSTSLGKPFISFFHEIHSTIHKHSLL